MPVRRMTLNFEYLTLFSSVQIRTHYGHMLTTLTKLYVLSLHVNSFFSTANFYVPQMCLLCGLYFTNLFLHTACSCYGLSDFAQSLVERLIKQMWYTPRSRTMQPNWKQILYFPLRPPYSNRFDRFPGKDFSQTQQQTSCTILWQM